MSQDAKSEKNHGNLPQIRSIALIALGSNIPFGYFSVEQTIAGTLDRIGREVGVIRHRSDLFRTPAFPKGSGPEFLNGAVAVETDLPAAELMSALHGIEKDFGRDRTKRWGPRTLDLDLVAFDDLVLPDRQTHEEWTKMPLEEQMRRVPDGLILPHPRLAERAFVLVPLAQVAANWVHPVTGLSVGAMLDALPKALRDEVVPL